MFCSIVTDKASVIKQDYLFIGKKEFIMSLSDIFSDISQAIRQRSSARRNLEFLETVCYNHQLAGPGIIAGGNRAQIERWHCNQIDNERKVQLAKERLDHVREHYSLGSVLNRHLSFS